MHARLVGGGLDLLDQLLAGEDRLDPVGRLLVERVGLGRPVGRGASEAGGSGSASAQRRPNAERSPRRVVGPEGKSASGSLAMVCPGPSASCAFVSRRRESAGSRSCSLSSVTAPMRAGSSRRRSPTSTARRSCRPRAGRSHGRRRGRPPPRPAARRARRAQDRLTRASPSTGSAQRLPGRAASISARTKGSARPRCALSSERAQAEADALDRELHVRHERLDLHGRTAVLVDDGLATGATMIAAVRWARAAGRRSSRGRRTRCSGAGRAGAARARRTRSSARTRSDGSSPSDSGTAVFTQVENGEVLGLLDELRGSPSC